MWCPKCKNEYIDGITTCVDCGCDLVAELPEEIDETAPQLIGSVVHEDVGNKFIRFLKFSGVRTCGLIPLGDADGPEEMEAMTDEPSADADAEREGFYIAVSYAEAERARAILNELSADGETDGADLEKLEPALDAQFEEIKEEEANELLSDLRTETSTVYVNKRDKYTDLKFTAYSFIAFSILGYLFVIANAAGIISIFSTFSTAILAIVFTIFLGIGISSFRKAGTIKGLVSEEERVVEKVKEYIEEHFTDEYLASLGDEELSEEEEFLHVTEQLKAEIAEQFPLFNKGYIDQLVDDKYGDFCDRRTS